MSSSALSMEVAVSSETLVSLYQTTRCHVSVEHNRRVLFAVRTKAPNQLFNKRQVYKQMDKEIGHA